MRKVQRSKFQVNQNDSDITKPNFSKETDATGPIKVLA